jgi:hypothetical protein
MTMTLIETKTLGSGAASIEFTSIPQDGTDLFILCSLRGATSGLVNQRISFNGSTANFTARTLEGNGASSGSVSVTNGNIGNSNDNGTTANTFNNISITIPNYTISSNKNYLAENVTENNAATAYQHSVAGLWSNTAAITSLAISAATGNLSTGSTISLYKITKGSDGIVTVS